MSVKAINKPRCPMRSWKVWTALTALGGLSLVLKAGWLF